MKLKKYLRLSLKPGGLVSYSFFSTYVLHFDIVKLGLMA